MSITPTWLEFGDVTLSDTWVGLTDTASSISAGLVVQGNSGGTALEFGQALATTDSPTFAQVTVGNSGLIVGSSTPFSDSSGTLTLQNIDVLDVTTEATIESAIDTLSNLTSATSLVSVGALDSGSITSNFGSINTGSSTIQTTGLATLGSLRVTGTFADSSGDVGTNGQLLSSTVTGTNWIDEAGGGNVSNTGTPVNNQLAIWTDATTIEGDADLTFDGSNLATTGRIRTGDGTELLPAYAFTTSTSSGMRYDSSTPAVAFSLGGQDILKLTSAGNNFLKIETGNDAGGDFVGIEPDGTETDVTLHLVSKGGGSIEINNDTGAGDVFIGEGDTIQIANTGAVAIGLQSNLGPPNTTGNVLILGAPTSFTRTRMILRSPINANQLTIGSNDTATDSGSSFIENESGTEMRLQNTAGTAISISSLDVTFAGDLIVDTTTLFVDASASSIGMGSLTLEASALLTMTSTTQGFLLPRMTDVQRDAISSPASGLQIYDSDDDAIDFFNGSVWRRLVNASATTLTDGGVTFASGSSDSSIDTDAANLFWDNTNKRLGIGTASPLAKLHLDAGNILQTPDDPTLTGVLIDATNLNGANDVFVVDNYAYVISGGSDSLSIIDVSVPSTPVLEGSLLDSTNMDGPFGLFVSGNHAYVTGSNSNSLAIVDISNPNSPTLAGSLIDSTNLDRPFRLYVAGKYAYISCFDSNSLVIVDVSDPSSPSITGTLVDATTLNGANAVYVAGNYAYVASFTGDYLAIIDITDPFNPTLTGSLTDGTNLNGVVDIKVVGKFAYIAGQQGNSLAVVDVSNPAAPSITGTLTDGTNLQNPRGLTVAGDFVYMATETNNALAIIDISTPSTPVIVGQLVDATNLDGARGVYVSGKLIYVGSGTSNSLSILNLHGIESPAASIGNIEAGELNVSANAVINNSLYSRTLNVGNDALIGGSLAIGGNKASRIASEVKEIFSTLDYTNLGESGVITTSTDTLALDFKTSVVSSTRFVISARTHELQLIDQTESNGIIYIGTSPLITSTVGGDFSSKNATIVAAIPNTKLFDYVGDGTLSTVDVVSLSGVSALVGWDLGTIGRVSTTELGPIVTFKDGAVVLNSSASLVLDSVSIFGFNSVFIDQEDATGFGASIVSIKDSAYKGGRATFFTLTGNLYSGEKLVRVDAGLPDTYRVNVFNTNLVLNGTATVFDTTGSTGTFTAVADNSISATAITGVTDSSGVASFTHAGTSPLLGSLATVSGFVTNTAYNTTGIVTATTATTFEIDYVAFGTSETGSYLVTGVTVTATAHGLTIGTGTTLDTTQATDYDGGFLIYNIQTNSFDVPATFTQTEAGTWSTEGLDQTDPRVGAFNNPGTARSHAIACGFVNDNTTATGTIVNNTFTEMVFGTAGSALTESSTTERWKLIEDVNGVFEYKGLEPFDGLITFDFTVESSGGTVDFRFKWVKSTDGGSSFSDLADVVEALVAVGSDAQSVTKTFPLVMDKGDQIKPQITRNSGSSGITSTYASIYVANSG